MHLDSRISDAKLFRVTYQRTTRLTTPAPEVPMYIVTNHWATAANMAAHMVPQSGLRRVCFEEIEIPEEMICGEFIGGA